MGLGSLFVAKYISHCASKFFLKGGRGKLILFSHSGIIFLCAGGDRKAINESYLVDPASSHMLVSKIKPCMSKYKQICTVKLRMAH